MSRILVVTDAWEPQTNGVVRTLQYTNQELEKMGHDVRVIAPEVGRRLTFPLPTYPEIQLDCFSYGRIRQAMKDFRPDYVHIATEGPLGWAARRVCLLQSRPFSTAYHTSFPDYVAKRASRGLRRLLRKLTYIMLRRFHAPSGALMVATPSIARELTRRNFRRVLPWSRGVDTELFRLHGKTLSAYRDLPRPISLYVGRVAVEKNLDEFLRQDIPGSKVIIGDGPDLELLRRRYPAAHFLGKKTGIDLALHYAAADLFVFPSKTDTFGLVLLEALACGLPVAACPAPGPKDIFTDLTATESFVALDDDIGRAMRSLLARPATDPNRPRAFAMGYSWARCTEQFMHHLQAETDFGKRRTRRIARLIDWAQTLRRKLFRSRS
jgi:glycosyltransferase involved in cell wall biosynthesis